MRARFERATGFGREVLDVVREKDVTFLAGSIAYSAFVSLFPLLLLTVLAVAVLGGPALRATVVGAATAVSPSLDDLIRRRLLAGGSAGASLVGAVTLLWGSLKLFRGLDTAFSQLYATEDENGFVEQVSDGLVVLVAIAAAVATTALATVALSLFSFVPFVASLDSAFLFGGLVLAFLPMYYVFPDADVTVREVLPGTVVAAAGWTLLQGLFEVYVLVSGNTGHVDVFTGVILLLTWLYFGGLVLLVGAAVNAVRGDHAERAALADALDGGDLDRETAAAYLASLGDAFARSDRTDVSDVSVTAPRDIEIEEHEFLFGEDGEESTKEVTVRWADRGRLGAPADD